MVPPAQVFVHSHYIHHLLTRLDLEQLRHLLVQSPVHMRPVDLVKRVREHPSCLMKEGPCNRTPGCVLYVCTRIGSHLLSFDYHADRLKRKCLLQGKICILRA
jgi:hypothetical protein